MKKKSLLAFCALIIFFCSCSNEANPESEVMISETASSSVSDISSTTTETSTIATGEATSYIKPEEPEVTTAPVMTVEPDVTTAPVVTTKPATTTTAPVTIAKPAETQVVSFTLGDGQVLENLVFPLTKPDMSNDWVIAHADMFIDEDYGYLRSVGIIDNETGIPIKDPFGMPMCIYFPTVEDEINFMTWSQTVPNPPAVIGIWADPSLTACLGWEESSRISGKCLPYTAYDQYGNYFGPEVFQQTVNHRRY